MHVAVEYALRAVGLDIINSLARKWTGRNRNERPKVIMHKSFWIALSRTLVHLLPLSVFASLIYINYNTLYIGPSFTWKGQQSDAVFSAMIQVAAKAQELLCVASLAAIVLQALRQELLHEGLPIGLLGSGLWFSQISSFWSPEFLAAAPWSIKSARRIRFFLLLVVAGLLAAVIGPASAVLMLPRDQEIPAGGTSFYLNGSPNEIWPSVVSSTAEAAICLLANSTDYPVCPGGGYSSVLHTLQTLESNQTSFCKPVEPSVGQEFAPQCQAKGITGWRYWNNLMVQSTQNLLPPVLSSFSNNNRADGETVVIQPHVATVISMRRIVRAWSRTVGASIRAPWNQYKWSYGLVASGSSTNPWTRVKCGPGLNLSRDASEVGFPYLQPHEEYPGTTFSRGHRYSSIAEMDRNVSSRIRAQWTPLPLDEFGDLQSGTHTAGLFVELPWKGDSRVGFGCAIAASWHNSTVVSDRTANYGAWSALITGMEYTWNYPGLVESPGSFQTNKPIKLDQSWLRLLTPRLSSTLSNNTSSLTTLEDIFTRMRIADIVDNLRSRPGMHVDRKTNRCVYGMRDSNETDTQLWNANDCGGGTGPYVQLIIGSIVADGLSRFGSHRTFDNVDLPFQDWSLKMPQTFNSSLLLKNLPRSTANLASQWVSISVSGWAYYASETTDYLALAVACVYICIATAHVLWLLYWGHWVSSSSWDTVTELLVLCKNSPSTPSRLKNTSGGIHRLSTLKTIVKVRVIEEESDSTEVRGVVDEKGEGKEKIVLVEESENKIQDEMKLALLGAVTSSTAAAPLLDPNIRHRAKVRSKVVVDVRYG